MTLARFRALLALHRVPVRLRVLHGLASGLTFALPLMSRYRVNAGSVYVALIRLEHEGLVRSEWAPGPEPRRRMYRPVLLRAEDLEQMEDLDGLLSNAWRAIRADPDAVAYHADQPVVEVDLHARHVVLVTARDEVTARLMADPDFYDARLAGWWVWGACNWIGSGWCDGSGPWVVRDGLLVNRREVGELAGDSRKLPHLGDAGKGVSKQLPHLGNAGTGVARSGIGVARQVPYLASAGVGDSNPGTDGSGIRRKLPNLTSHGSGMNSEYARTSPGVLQWMHDLSERLRRVRICCGSWDRVVGESVTTKHGLTAVFLDPPYNAEDADNAVYGVDHDTTVSAAAHAWAIQNAGNPLLRIALCGYDGEHEMPGGWVKVGWKARKGY